MVVAAGAVAASCAASLAVMVTPAVGAVGAVAWAGGWGRAIEVPGLGQLSAGHGGTLNEVSCSSPGNCAAGGMYDDSLGHLQAFVVSEKDGSWGAAIEVPGLAALNTGGDARVNSVSCGSAGDCVAGGSYLTSSRSGDAFVVSERNGSWGKAMQVPGSTALSGAAGAYSVDSVSCPSAALPKTFSI